MQFPIKQKNRKLHSTVSGSKATDGNRTRDLLTTNEVRYLLCHGSLLRNLSDYRLDKYTIFFLFCQHFFHVSFF